MSLKLLKKISKHNFHSPNLHPQNLYPPEPNNEPISAHILKTLVGGDAMHARDYVEKVKNKIEKPPLKVEPFFGGTPGVYWTDSNDNVFCCSGNDGSTCVDLGHGDLLDNYCSPTAIAWWEKESEALEKA